MYIEENENGGYIYENETSDITIHCYDSDA